MALDAADHPAATMEEHDYGMRARCIGRPIDADGNLTTIGSRDLAILDFRHLRHIGLGHLALFHLAAHLIGCDPRRMELEPHRLHAVHHRLGLRVECHWSPYPIVSLYAQ